MKHIATFVLLLFAVWGSGQSTTYTYSLDTFHTAGAALRTDSLYLVEQVTGYLVTSDAVLGTTLKGDRTQTLSTPIFFSDTAAITTYADNLLQDSINLAEKIKNLRAQADIYGAKARAIQHVRDSVIYGAWLYELPNPYKFQPGHQDTRMGYVDPVYLPTISMAAILPEKRPGKNYPKKE